MVKTELKNHNNNSKFEIRGSSATPFHISSLLSPLPAATKTNHNKNMEQKGDGKSLEHLKENKGVMDQQINVARSELKNLRFAISTLNVRSAFVIQ